MILKWRFSRSFPSFKPWKLKRFSCGARKPHVGWCLFLVNDFTPCVELQSCLWEAIYKEKKSVRSSVSLIWVLLRCFSLPTPLWDPELGWREACERKCGSLMQGTPSACVLLNSLDSWVTNVILKIGGLNRSVLDRGHVSSLQMVVKIHVPRLIL